MLNILILQVLALLLWIVSLIFSITRSSNKLWLLIQSFIAVAIPLYLLSLFVGDIDERWLTMLNTSLTVWVIVILVAGIRLAVVEVVEAQENRR